MTGARRRPRCWHCSTPARAARLRERLDVYQTSILPVIEERTRQVGSQRAGRGWRFTLEYGISSIEWELAWIEQALLQLQRLAPD